MFEGDKGLGLRNRFNSIAMSIRNMNFNMKQYPPLSPFQNSLSEVVSKLQACTPHFVECVRPNSSDTADSFDSCHVSTQLQYVGVLEMVQMIRYGYPVRLPFNSFLTR